MRYWPQFLVRIGCLMLVGLLAGCNNLFFFPSSQLMPFREDLSFEEVRIQSEDRVVITGWYFSESESSKPPVLFLHGNAENISTHIYTVLWLVRAGYPVLGIDYRGYGRSEGSVNLKGALKDARAALRWLAAKHAGGVLVFGQSLGGAIALAAYRDAKMQALICGAVFEGVFSSYRQIVREKLGSLFLTWPLQYPLSWLFSDRLRPDSFGDEYQGLPMVFVHSQNDPVVYYNHGKRLAETYNAPFWSLAQAPHGAAFLSSELRERFFQFSAKHCSSERD